MNIDINHKEIHRLAIPALIAGVAEPLLSISDAAFLGHLPDLATESLAAAGLAGAFLSMLIWVLGQVRSAVSTLVSQYLGAGRQKEIEPLPAQVMVSVFIISILIIALTYPLAPYIFKLYNARDVLLDITVQYYRIRIFGFPFTLITFVIFGTFRGLQNTSYPMRIALAGTIINIILDYLLIFGVEGFLPALQIRGAAYASVISQIMMMSMAIFVLYRKTSIRISTGTKIHPEMKRLYKMVLDLFIRTLSLNIALYFGSAFAAKYGEIELAAYSMAIQIWFFYAFVLDGYAGAGNILAGKLYGAKRYKDLHNLGKTLLIYGLGTGLLLLLVSFIFYPYFGRFFIRDTSVQDMFYSFFWMVALMQPVNGVAFIFDGIFKGLGFMSYLRNVLLIATFLGFVPVLFWADFSGWRVYGIWMAFTVWMLLRGGLLWYRFNKLY